MPRYLVERIHAMTTTMTVLNDETQAVTAEELFVLLGEVEWALPVPSDTLVWSHRQGTAT